MRDFHEEIKYLRIIRKELITKEQCLQDNMKKEKEEAIKSIGDKYLPNIKSTTLNILKNEEEMAKFNEKVIECSTFKCSFFVEIMREIIRIYEGENFIYKEIKYCPDSKQKIKHKRAKVLISDKRNSFIKHDIDISKLYAVQKNGDGIILDWNDSFFANKYINFYTINDSDELKTNIKLNRFPYLKQFVDFVISYHIENENYVGPELMVEEIEKLKNEFIFNNLENIKKYHEMVKFDEQRKSEKEIERNAEYRNKQLTKALNKKM